VRESCIGVSRLMIVGADAERPMICQWSDDVFTEADIG